MLSGLSAADAVEVAAYYLLDRDFQIQTPKFRVRGCRFVVGGLGGFCEPLGHESRTGRTPQRPHSN